MPYIAHPMRVAMIVRDLFRYEDASTIAAAFLHDVVEKCAVTPASLVREFGTRVAEMVSTLSKNTGGPRKEYWERLTAADWEVRLVKMADALDHLDCPPDDLPRRIKSGNKALALAFTDEPPLLLARELLDRSIADAALRLKRNPPASAGGQ